MQLFASNIRLTLSNDQLVATSRYHDSQTMNHNFFAKTKMTKKRLSVEFNPFPVRWSHTANNPNQRKKKSMKFVFLPFRNEKTRVLCTVDDKQQTDRTLVLIDYKQRK